MSDREQHALRGPVRQWVAETVYAGAKAADGSQVPESRFRHVAEYTLEGQITAIHILNSDVDRPYRFANVSVSAIVTGGTALT
jgi:hypothetical protein